MVSTPSQVRRGQGRSVAALLGDGNVAAEDAAVGADGRRNAAEVSGHGTSAPGPASGHCPVRSAMPTTSRWRRTALDDRRVRSAGATAPARPRARRCAPPLRRVGAHRRRTTDRGCWPTWYAGSMDRPRSAVGSAHCRVRSTGSFSSTSARWPTWSSSAPRRRGVRGMARSACPPNGAPPGRRVDGARCRPWRSSAAASTSTPRPRCSPPRPMPHARWSSRAKRPTRPRERRWAPSPRS